jgi:hypothetical protein
VQRKWCLKREIIKLKEKGDHKAKNFDSLDHNTFSFSATTKMKEETTKLTFFMHVNKNLDSLW